MLDRKPDGRDGLWRGPDAGAGRPVGHGGGRVQEEQPEHVVLRPLFHALPQHDRPAAGHAHRKYAKDKFDYKRIIKENEAGIHTQVIEEEMEKHRKWREKTSLTATPTVLVNGHKLPDEYELEDLAMIANIAIIGKNILQDINGRSTTPLGAESQSAEETV